MKEIKYLHETSIIENRAPVVQKAFSRRSQHGLKAETYNSVPSSCARYQVEVDTFKRGIARDGK
jgi:hypothetical protein